MHRRRQLAVLLLTLGLLGACGSDTPSPQLKVATGAPFPTLQFTTLNGEPASTGQFRGRALVLNVWATWCAPCRKELPSLQRLAEQFDAERLIVVGMAIDADDHLVREFLIDRKVSFRNFQDARRVVANDVLGVRAYPSTFLVSGDGILRAVVEGSREWDDAQSVQQVRALLNDSSAREALAPK
jgi:thiol-disulfide isomerase/thioredoxin